MAKISRKSKHIFWHFGRQRIGLLCALGMEAALLAGMSRFGDFSAPGTAGRFVGLAFAAGGAFWLAASRFSKLRDARQQALFLWSGAVLLRLAILPIEPGDDLWRYLWEGRIQQHGFSPYAYAPDAPALASLRALEPNWWRINHPSWSTIYPPATELVFFAVTSLGGGVYAFKLLFAAADLLSLHLLIRLLKQNRLPYRLAAFYGWNPLPIYCFAGAAHFDSLMLAATLGAVVCLFSSLPSPNNGSARPPGGNRAALLLSTAFLGLAVSLKVVPMFYFPLWFFVLGRRFYLLGITLAVPLWFSVLYGYPSVDIFASLQKFAEVARTNELLLWVLERVVLPHSTQSTHLYHLITGAAVVAASWVFRKEPLRALLWVTGALLVFAPSLHAWYATWILPFAVLQKSRFWLGFSVSIFGYFLLWESTALWQAWESNLWLWLLQVTPPLVLWWFQPRSLPLTPLDQTR